MGKYDDIIHLPHPVSIRHPQMPMSSRAAQFMPFRPLTGYGDAILETARLTEQQIDLDENEKALLDAKLQILADEIENHPRITVTYFRPDDKKAGGAYVTVTGEIKRIDGTDDTLVFMSGEKVRVADILRIQKCKSNP